MKIQSCSELQEFDDARFVKKNLYKGNGNVVFLLHLLPGQEIPAHTHPGKEVFLLGLQGRGSLWIGGEHHTLGCQDFVYCGDEDALRIYNDGKEGWVLYVVLAAKKEPEVEQAKKPIKRHPSLFPLSHHHHHALVMSRQLKQQKEEPAVLREKLKKFWNEGGQRHFREEEEILLPTYSRYASVERPEITEMLMEHVRIRGQVEEILEGEEEPSGKLLYN